MGRQPAFQQPERQSKSDAPLDSPPGERRRCAAAQNVALIERYLNLRVTRLSRNMIAAYRADLLHFADTLGSTLLLAATSAKVATWFRTHMRSDEDPDDPAH